MTLICSTGFSSYMYCIELFYHFILEMLKNSYCGGCHSKSPEEIYGSYRVVDIELSLIETKFTVFMKQFVQFQTKNKIRYRKTSKHVVFTGMYPHLLRHVHLQIFRRGDKGLKVHYFGLCK